MKANPIVGNAGQGELPLPTGEKFVEVLDLGMITVPDGYWWNVAVKEIYQHHRSVFGRFNRRLNEDSFCRPSRILESGESLLVRLYCRTVVGQTKLSEIVEFLMKKGCVNPGLPGLMLTWLQKKGQLGIGSWYVAPDHRENLFQEGNISYVPDMYVGSNVADFGLREAMRMMDEDVLFFGYYEVER